MKKLFYTLVALSMLTAVCNAQVSRVTETIAGHTPSGYTGDGGPARYALLSYPLDVCSDPAGNIYVADQTGTRIRKIDARTGIITTIAGTGTTSVATDGVPATASYISASHIIADDAGNIYLAYGSLVRRIDAVTGIITAFAGSTMTGFLGDGWPATAARFNTISGICTDHAGNLYISDQRNHRVRKVDGVTNIVTTFAGSASSGHAGDGGPATDATLSNPTYITADAAGNIIFMDGDEVYFRKVDAMTGIISTYSMTRADPSVITGLSGSSGLCSGGSDIYFDETSCSCRGMSLSTGVVSWTGGNYFIESFADDTTSVYAYMNENRGLCTDALINIYIADDYNNRVRKLLNLTHKPSFVFGPGQTASVCGGSVVMLDSLLWATDMDLGQTETWTVITPPLYGTLSGFPVSMPSRGSFSSSKPSGLAYTPSTSYSGPDQFRISVSDGTLSDTITIYVNSMSYAGVISGPSAVCAGSTIALSETMSGGTWSISGTAATIDGTGRVTGLTGGTCTVNYLVTGSGGCPSSSTTFNVTVNDMPVIGSIDGTPTVCVGGITPIVSLTPGGTWVMVNTRASFIDSISSVLGITPGWDTLIYTLTDGACTAMTSAAVLVIAQPYAGTITGSTSVCVGRTVSLADAIPGGNWTVSNTNGTVSAAGILLGTTPGTMQVYYIVSNYCGYDTARYAVTVTDCITGVANVSPVRTGQVAVFPNPASDAVTIAWQPLGVATAGITVADAAGRILLRDELQGTATQGTKDIDITHLPSGVYMITVDAGGTRYVSKLVINK